MSKNKQSILGNNNVGVIIGSVYYDANDVYKSICDSFEKCDKEINSFFPDGIEYSKLDDIKREFRSSKIFSSLVKTDIPLEDAFYIVHKVALTLLEEIHEKKYEDGLSTHIIRKVVANTILNYPRENITDEEVEKWADKYVRKYGHDAQRVEIYFENGENNVKVDFDFIKDRLLEDIIMDLEIRDKAYKHEISSRQISLISREIIEFINDCNMYKINYNTLKEFIMEMALQPPHPWFVTCKTAKRIAKYDVDVLQKHYGKLCSARDNNKYDNLYYTVYEALHHSCSSILARYYEVLGCKDLDAFYNLERVISKLCKREEKDLLLEMYEIGNLPNDLKYISIELSDFHSLLRRIRKRLDIGKIASTLDKEYVSDVIELCNVARSLGNNVDKEEIESFLYSNWNEFSNDKVKRYIKKVFETINGLKVSRFLSEKPNCFWIKREYSKTEKEVFAIYVEDNIDFDIIIKFFKKSKAVLNTEAIFLILEYVEEKERYSNFIKELDSEQYYIEVVCKEDLKKIFTSCNKYSEFSKIIKRDLYS